MKKLILLSSLLLIKVFPVHSEDLHPATVLIVVRSDNPEAAAKAKLFIFDCDKKTFLKSLDIGEKVELELPKGHYRLSAGYTAESYGIVDHYASPEALVEVTGHDPLSILLSMKKSEPSEFILSDNSREKLDLDPDQAANLN